MHIFGIFSFSWSSFFKACWQYPAKLQFNAFTQNQVTPHQCEVNNCDSFIKKKKKSEWEWEKKDDNINERNSDKGKKNLFDIPQKQLCALSYTQMHSLS